MSHADIARRWRDFNLKGEGKPYGGGQSNVTYNDNALYSYNTVIAKWYADEARGHYVLVTANHYSHSSGNHVRQISTHGARRFDVPCIGAPGAWNRDDYLDMQSVHRENLHHFTVAVDHAIAELKRTWKDDLPDAVTSWRREYPWERLTSAIARREAYAMFFELPFKPDFFLVLREEIMDHRAAKCAEFMQPKAVEKRERARARRLLRKVFIRREG